MSKSKHKKKTSKQTKNIKKEPLKKATVSPEQEQTSWLPFLLSALSIALVTFWVYQGSLDNDFVDWDDYAYVIENNLVRSQHDIDNVARLKSQGITAYDEAAEHTTTIGDIFSRPISLNYHPLTILTMRWNNNTCPDCMNGISARPFILWNIILHILNAILLLLLLYRLTDKNWLASLAIAAIFALHPMHVESVAWVSERKDVLYTFFLLAALWSYTQYIRIKGTKWLLITLTLFVLSCLSKAMAVIFPLLMLLVYYWEYSNKEKPLEALKNMLSFSKLKHTIPFFMIALFFGLMATKIQGGGNFLGFFDLSEATQKNAINDFDTFSLLQRFQFAAYGFLEYIVRFFVPHHLSAFHAYPTEEEYQASFYIWYAPLFFLAFMGLVLGSLKYTKSLAVGIGFYLAAVILVLQFISVGMVITADRYTYLPYIGLAFALIMLIVEYAPQTLQKPILGGTIAFALFLGTMTMTQVETWQDSEVLWTNVIDKHTNVNAVHQNMAQPLSIRGNYYGKKSDYLRFVKKDETAANLYIDKAFNDFVLAEKLGSKKADVYQGLGNSYGMKKQYQKALEAFSKAIEYGGENGSIYFNRGVTYGLLKQYDKAAADYTKTIKLSPNQALIARINRGISYIELKQYDKATLDFKNILQVDPKNTTAQYYLNQLTK